MPKEYNMLIKKVKYFLCVPKAVRNEDLDEFLSLQNIARIEKKEYKKAQDKVKKCCAEITNKNLCRNFVDCKNINCQFYEDYQDYALAKAEVESSKEILAEFWKERIIQRLKEFGHEKVR